MRVYWHVYSSIETHVRVDEILAGACLALVYSGFMGGGLKKLLGMWAVQPVLAVLLLLSCHPIGGALNYGRPYFAAALVGTTLLQANVFQWVLLRRSLAYVAAISYALYIVHPLTLHGWLGGAGGNKVVMYAKRPLCFVISFGLAHLSTFTWEKYWIGRGKVWSADRRKEVATQPV
jgi:peptidoglycan/LPS O-acetylase OafA/YrhL